MFITYNRQIKKKKKKKKIKTFDNRTCGRESPRLGVPNNTLLSMLGKPAVSDQRKADDSADPILNSGGVNITHGQRGISELGIGALRRQPESPQKSVFLY